MNSYASSCVCWAVAIVWAAAPVDQPSGISGPGSGLCDMLLYQPEPPADTAAGQFMTPSASTGKSDGGPATPRGGCGCAGVGTAVGWNGNGDGVNWSDAGNWSWASAPGVGGQNDFCVTMAMGGPTVTMDVNVTICVLNIGMAATLNINDATGRTLAVTDTDGLLSNNIINIHNNGNRLEAAGMITNNGSIDIDADVAGTAELVPTALGTTLTGTGAVQLSTPTDAIVGSNSLSWSLINDTNHTISGTGNVRGNFTNNGLVLANSSSETLLVDGSVGTARTNNSTFRAGVGGTLRIGSPLLQGASGVIEAVTTGTVLIEDDVTGTGSYTADGGTVRLDAGGGMNSVAGATLDAINAGLIEIVGDADFDLTGAVTIDTACTYMGAAGASGTLTATSASVLGGGGGGGLGPTNGGAMILTDTMRAEISGALLIDGTATPCPSFALGCIPPILKVLDSAHLEADSLTVRAGDALFGGTSDPPIICSSTVNVTNALTIEEGGLVRDEPCSNTVLTVGSISILADPSGSPSGSTLQIGDSMSATVSGNVMLTDCAPSSDPLFLGCTPPILRVAVQGSLDVAGNLVADGAATLDVLNFATLNVDGDLTLGDLSVVFVESMNDVTLGGSFANQSTNPSGFDWSLGSLTLNAGGPVQQFELAGRDHGVDAFLGFQDNFAMDSLTIADNSCASFVHLVDNGSGEPCEVLYVNTLTLGAGSKITLNCNVYYNNLIDLGAASIAEAGGALVCLTPPGDMNCDGGVDFDDLDIFIAVLLGLDTHPGHTASADLNLNGTPDGGDIQGFVDEFQ